VCGIIVGIIVVNTDGKVYWFNENSDDAVYEIAHTVPPSNREVINIKPAHGCPTTSS